MDSNTTTRDAILRMAEVTRAVGLGRATVYRMMQRGEFPASIPLSGSAVGWLRSEIEGWIAERVNLRDVQHAVAA
jgi:prophage regulatory protein